MERAKLQFAKVAQACKKEAVKLTEALRNNEEELKAAEANLCNAETAFKLLEKERQAADGTQNEEMQNCVEAERKEAEARMAQALEESMQAMRHEKDKLNPGEAFSLRSTTKCDAVLPLSRTNLQRINHQQTV